MKKICILLLMTFMAHIGLTLFAQVTIGSNIPANSGSLLDLKQQLPDANNSNSTKGLLLPRVKLVSATQMLPDVTSDQYDIHTGLVVYHTGNVNLCKGLYVWMGAKWEPVPSSCVIKTKWETAQLNGTYKVGTALAPATNTITLDIEVPSAALGGTYTIYTDTQNGMSFSATQPLAPGTQQIIMAGTGTPKQGGVGATFTIYVVYSNSTSSNSSYALTLPANLIPIASASIFGFGLYPSTYGYFLDVSASRGLVTSSKNFGTAVDSKVKVSPPTFAPSQTVDGLTVANFINNATGFKSNPDIIVNGYHSNTTDAIVIDSLIRYLNRGGVLIMFDEYNSATANITLQLCKKLFPVQAAGISRLDIPSSGGGSFTMNAAVNDDITNGPFGDMRNLFWGDDLSNAGGLTGLPADSIVTYSTGTYKAYTNGAVVTTYSNYVTMFKHKRLNLFWVGDGGFVSNFSNTAGSTYLAYRDICPFSINTLTNSQPIARTNWGYNGLETVHNSEIFANVMYWAFKNAKSNNRK